MQVTTDMNNTCNHTLKIAYLVHLCINFRTANDVIRNETKMFEKFYLKVEPKESISTLQPANAPSLPTQEVS